MEIIAELEGERRGSYAGAVVVQHATVNGKTDNQPVFQATGLPAASVPLLGRGRVRATPARVERNLNRAIPASLQDK